MGAIEPVVVGPMGEKEYIALKEEFNKEWDKAVNDHQKAWLLIEKLCRSHYWRACESLDHQRTQFIYKILGFRSRDGYNLEIDKYTKHWLFSMKDHPFFTEGILEEIYERFGYKPEESKYLPKGHTMYVDNLSQSANKGRI